MVSDPKASMTRTKFSKAYRSGFDRTVRFLLSRGIVKPKAEESAQAAWAKGWEKRSHLREPSRVVEWVNSIALNNYRGRLRKEQLEEALPVIDPPAPPRDVNSRLDMEKSAGRCSQRDWKLLRDRYVKGFTSVEIAEDLGVKPVTIRVRLSRAKQKLRSCLTR